MNYTYSKGILEQEGCRPNQRMLISTRKGKTEEKKIGKKIKGGEKKWNILGKMLSLVTWIHGYIGVYYITL